MINNILAKLSFKNSRQVIFILLFAAIGIVLLALSRAAPVFSPASLAETPIHVGTSYSSTLSVGQTATWSITSGSLPKGLSLSTSGTISGLPKYAGTFSFTVKAQLSSSFITKGYTIMVYPTPPSPGNSSYDSRVDKVVSLHLTRPFPPINDPSTGGALYYATAALWKNQDTVNANNLLTQVRSSSLNELRLSILLRPYYLYFSSSSFLPGRLTSAAENNLVTQIWDTASTTSTTSAASKLWTFPESENIDTQHRGFNLLAAQILKNRSDYATRLYADGHTASQQYQAWRNYWMTKFDQMAKKGLFTEVASPTYIGYQLAPIVNIYDFAEDPILRQKAGMILDLTFADFADNQLKNVWAGGKSRAYPEQNYDGNDAIYPIAGLLFGPDTNDGNHTLYFATSGYNPPDAIKDLAINTANKANYEYVRRTPDAGNGSLKNITNLQYSYVTPDYIMSGAIVQPGANYSWTDSAHRWLGTIFGTQIDARVYPALTAVRNKSQDLNNNFYSVQKKGASIYFANPAYKSSNPTMVYFGQSLDVINEDSTGWIFVQEANAYLAIRPQYGGYTWLTASKNQDSNPANRFISLTNRSSPIIMEAANSIQYGGNFTAFKNKIKSNFRSFSFTTGLMNYTASDGSRLTLDTTLKTVPKINGTSVNFAPQNVFFSPYINSVYDSGKVIINSLNSKTESLDFSNTNAPIKTVNP